MKKNKQIKLKKVLFNFYEHERRNNHCWCFCKHCDIFPGNAENVYVVTRLNVIFLNKISLHTSNLKGRVFKEDDLSSTTFQNGCGLQNPI